MEISDIRGNIFSEFASVDTVNKNQFHRNSHKRNTECLSDMIQ